MRGVGLMENVYQMYNPRTKAKIKCTTKYLPMWLARGFEVNEVTIVDRNDIQRALGVSI